MKKHLMKMAALTAVFAVTAFNLPINAAEEADAPPAEKSEADSPTLKAGSAVPSLEGAKAIQGSLPTSLNEPGKVYLIECWATWCGPCVAVIPHVNELHTKYASKGLSVVGMNVWEDGEDKVKKFVEEQGKGMSYPVAYSGGQDSKFAATWLKASGVNGIPRAFLVKDGKLLVHLHPSSITDEVIESCLAGQFDGAAFEKKEAEKEKKMQEYGMQVQPLIEGKKWTELETLAKKASGDGLKMFEQLIYLAQAAQGNYDSMAPAIEKGEKSGDLNAEMATQIIAQFGIENDALKALAPKAITYLEANGAKDELTIQNFQDRLTYARYLHIAGKADESKAQIKAVTEFVKSDKSGIPPQAVESIVKMFDKISKAQEAGNFPPLSELSPE